MEYIITLLFCIAILICLSNFISIQNIENNTFNFFCRITIVLTTIISVFAITVTKGKSVFIIPIIILLGLFYLKEIKISKPNRKQIYLNLKYLIWIIPIIIFQGYLNFDFQLNTPFVPSDDILLYSSFSEQVIKFGQENKYSLFSEFYPEKFHGISPYHYFEIWLNGLIGYIGKLSYTYCLNFVTYPLLIWLYLIGIISLIENFGVKITITNFFLPIILLFFGPIYSSVYEILFHDGNFFSTTVFTIVGFVKQTLPFSYYGQKHLPVYIFGILLIIFILQKKYIASILASYGMISSSFGIFPGVLGANSIFFLKSNNTNKKIIVSVSVILVVLFFGLIILNQIPLSKEISQKTFYLSEFMTKLNFKGEIMRILNKLFIPFVWFAILYFPFILLFIKYSKTLKLLDEHKTIIQYIVLSLFTGAIFTLILKGLNTDQFVTNLLPICNIICIVFFLQIYSKLSGSIQKRLLVFSVLISCFNFIFILTHNKDHRIVFSEIYSKEISTKINNEFNKNSNNSIAYLFSDEILYKHDLMMQYVYFPGKFIFISNNFNYYNLNYPYIKYPESSSSIAFAPYNQMRFFIEDRPISQIEFEKVQVRFLKEKSIKWLFCSKNTVIPASILQLVKHKYIDRISGEIYCDLK